MDIIRNSILYIISVLLGVVTVAGFMTSIPVGLLLLAATILSLPVTQNLLRNLTGKKLGKGAMALLCLLLAALLAAGGGALAAKAEQQEADAQLSEAEVGQLTSDSEVLTDGEQELTDEAQMLIDDGIQSVSDIQTSDTQTSDTPTETSPVEQDTSQTSAAPYEMEVHFIDVGQGDATLIKCGEQAMLIDAGDDSKGSTVWNYLRKQGVDSLDYLILTHPDSDHIGGAPVILTKFDIGEVFVSNYQKDTAAYRKLVQTLDDQRLQASTPSVGSRYTLGDAVFTILSPGYYYDNANDASIALLVEHGENSFLFTGDAKAQAEVNMAASGYLVDADVYKAGHHGSSSASCVPFLNAVTPEYAVISCGAGNSYGHPHAEVLNNLRAMGTKVFRTDEQGSIVATSDRKEITWNCAPTESWQAGERTASSGSAEDEGDSDAEMEDASKEDTKQNTDGYVLNTNTMKFHLPDCSSVADIDEKNKETSNKTKEALIAEGYSACKNCNP